MRAFLLSSRIEIVQHDLGLMEPQVNSVSEIARVKASLAYAAVGGSCMVEDTGFAVDALGGFPGPYTRYAMETIGVEGLMRLSSSFQERICRFVSALVLVIEGGETVVFKATIRGRLAAEIGSGDTGMAWSPLVRVFIPEGYTAPLSTFSAATFGAFVQQTAAESVYGQCADWLRTSFPED